MTIKLNHSALAAVVGAAMAIGAGPVSAQDIEFISIGTGGPTGVYFVVGQSDSQYHAYTATGRFKDKRFDKLRAIFSVHSEPFQLIFDHLLATLPYFDLRLFQYPTGENLKTLKSWLDTEMV